MIRPRHWQDLASAGAGVLTLMSPWLAGYALVLPALANAVIVGALLFTVSVGAAVLGRPWVECAVVALGAWMVASPWALEFADAPARRVAVVLGGLVVALGAGSLATDVRRQRRAPRGPAG